MIDYLEELLEEEAAVDLEGRPLVTVGRKRVIQLDEEKAPDGEDRLGRSAEAEPEGVVREDGWGEVPAPEAEAVPWLETAALEKRTLAWLEASRGRASGVVSLAESLRRAGRAARMVPAGQGAVTVKVPGEGAVHRTVDLLELDRAVQRDARRYDGGFPLY